MCPARITEHRTRLVSRRARNPSCCGSDSRAPPRFKWTVILNNVKAAQRDSSRKACHAPAPPMWRSFSSSLRSLGMSPCTPPEDPVMPTPLTSYWRPWWHPPPHPLVRRLAASGSKLRKCGTANTSHSRNPRRSGPNPELRKCRGAFPGHIVTPPTCSMAST